MRSWMKGILFGCLLVLSGPAITCAEDEPTNVGHVRIPIQALTGSFVVNRIEIRVLDDSGTEEAFENLVDTGSGFSAVLALSPGDKAFNAISFDATDTQIGTGSAKATIVTDQTVNVVISILDSTGGDPTPALRPAITGVTSSEKTTEIKIPITLSVQASFFTSKPTEQFLWSAVCRDSEGAVSTNEGVFATPTATETDWSRDTEGECDIIITATDGFNNSAVSVTLAPITITSRSSGNANIGINLVPHNFIQSLTIDDGALFNCTITRDNLAAGATCNADALGAGQAVVPGSNVSVTITPAVAVDIADPGVIVSLAASHPDGEGKGCDGTITDAGDTDPTTFIWTAPTTEIACLLTGTINFDSLTDSVATGVLVAGPVACIDDNFEPNDQDCDVLDGACNAADQGSFASGETFTVANLQARNDDWFRFTVTTIGTQSVNIGVAANDPGNFSPPSVFRQAPGSTDVVPQSTNPVVSLEAGTIVFIHFSPATGIDSCTNDMTYSLTWTLE